MKNFEIGDLVRVIEHEHTQGNAPGNAPDLLGRLGKVICSEDNRYVGVQFFENINGHSCGDEGENGYCWYINKSKLIKEDLSTNYAISSVSVPYYISPNATSLEDCITEGIAKELDNKICEERKEMRIVQLYVERKHEKIHDEFNNKREEIKKQDEKYLKVLEAFEVLTNNGVLNLIDTSNYVFNKNIVEKLTKVDKEEQKAHEELEKLVPEVIAQLDICETYDQRVKVLKTYNILDKSNKIGE